MGSKRALVIFARLPVPGKVKTRLAAAVGNAAACTFYKAAAEHALQEAAKIPHTDVHLFYSDESDKDGIAQWTSSLGLQGLQFAHQLQEPDLGARMCSAFRSTLDGEIEKAVILGTDIPDINHATIKAAFDALDHSDVVLGPAVDGGYYLIGLRKIHKELLQGIKWSTPEVFTATVSNAKSLGMMMAPKETLPILQDIDELKDLQSWVQKCTTDTHPVYQVAHDIVETYSE